MVQEKYQEEKACDKKYPYRIIIIIIIIIIHNIKAATTGNKFHVFRIIGYIT